MGKDNSKNSQAILPQNLGFSSTQQATASDKLEALKHHAEGFDFGIFANQNNFQRQDDDAQGVDDDMVPFNVFQRFCVLLLAIHGQVDKYARSQELDRDGQ